MSIIITYNGIRVNTSNRAGPVSATSTTWVSSSPVSPAYQQPGSIDAAGMLGFAEPAKLNHQARTLGRFNKRASRWIGCAIAGLVLMSSASTQAQSREVRRDDPPRAEQRDTRSSASSVRQPNNVQPSAKPPEDLSQVHNQFHNNRQQIGAGPAVPRNVHIQQGRPLPKGYGKRLDERALRGMPRYDGYEWRRVGADIVLIAVTTGVVYAVLQGVLND